MAFYWHPCGNSASPLSAPVPISRINRSSRAIYPGARLVIRQAGRCGSPSTSRTFPRTPARFCGSAPAWVSRRISSSRPASRSPTAPSAGPAWTISTRSPSPATARSQAFEDWRRAERLSLVLLTTAAETSYLDHAFRDDQVLLFGRESAGVPEAVHAGRRCPPADSRCAKACARSISRWRWRMVAGEALRQTGGLAR